MCLSAIRPRYAIAKPRGLSQSLVGYLLPRLCLPDASYCLLGGDELDHVEGQSPFGIQAPPDISDFALTRGVDLAVRRGQRLLNYGLAVGPLALRAVRVILVTDEPLFSSASPEISLERDGRNREHDNS